jgi:hypothetical protein
MRISTDFLPDYVYEIKTDKAVPAATVEGVNIGAVMAYGPEGSGGIAAYFGFRLRDDQSESSGKSVSALFDVLKTLGAYDAKKLEIRSRPDNARYVMNSFPNGTVSIANHYRLFTENWYGSFFRDEKKDKELLKGRKLPPVEIILKNESLLGHKLSFQGTDTLSYKLDAKGNLTGFSGSNARGISIDGKDYAFSDKPITLTWSLIGDCLKNPLLPGLILVKAEEPCVLTLPNCLGSGSIHSGACSIDFYKTDLVARVEAKDSSLVINVTKNLADKWIAVWIA